MEKKRTKDDIMENTHISKHGYVVMLDILGFREYIRKTSIEKFIKLWKKIQKQAEDSVKDIEKPSKLMFAESYFISDTIVLCLYTKESDSPPQNRLLILSTEF